MRTEVSKDDEKIIMWLRAKGNSPCTIADKTGYDPSVVVEILELNKHKKLKISNTKMNYRKKLQYVVPLYERSYQPQYIHKMLNIPQPVIYAVLEEAGYSFGGIHIRRNDIDVYKVRAFSHTVFIGDKFRISADRDQDYDNIPGVQQRDIIVTVIKKYPRFVMTDCGDFQYVDLYMGKRL